MPLNLKTQGQTQGKISFWRFSLSPHVLINNSEGTCTEKLRLCHSDGSEAPGDV